LKQQATTRKIFAKVIDHYAKSQRWIVKLFAIVMPIESPHFRPHPI